MENITMSLNQNAEEAEPFFFLPHKQHLGITVESRQAQHTIHCQGFLLY